MHRLPSVLLLCTLCVLDKSSALPGAVEFDIADEDSVNDVIHDAEVLSNSRLKVTDFSWKDCGGNISMTVKSLDISPDPIVTPGALFVAADFLARASLGAPLTGYVLMEKKIRDHYVKLPCVADVGSCTYDNLCELLEQVQCPSSVVKTGWNCRCPISPGTYSMAKSEFDINASFIPSGDYHIMGNVTHGTNAGVCLDLYVSFQN